MNDTCSQSAVEFPGAFRVHISLFVRDLEASKKFYRTLFEDEPTKEREGYVKFEPSDPSVNLTLNAVKDAADAGSSVSHFGVQVKTVEAVHRAIDKFKSAGYATTTEEQTTCCFAVQDKVWVADPDGNQWEVFVVLEADAKDDLYERNGCCTPEVAEIELPK